MAGESGPIATVMGSLAHFDDWASIWPRKQTMGHAERIIAELATLDEQEQARLLAYVQELKAGRSAPTKASELTAAQVRERDALAAELAPFRVSFTGYKFDRKEANAR